MWVFHYQVKILRRNEKFIYAKKCFCKDVLNLSVTWVTWLHSSSKNKKIKNKKINSVKISYIFSKKIIIFWVMEFSGPTIKEKSFLIFFKKKSFSYILGDGTFLYFFQKKTPYFSTTSSKIFAEKNFLYPGALSKPRLKILPWTKFLILFKKILVTFQPQAQKISLKKISYIFS